MAPAVDQAFRAIGRGISNFFIIALALILSLGIRVAVISASICVVVLLPVLMIAAVVSLFGPLHGGVATGFVILTMGAFIGCTACVGWFVISYVWEPHLRPAANEAAIALFRHAEEIGSKARMERDLRNSGVHADVIWNSKNDEAG